MPLSAEWSQIDRSKLNTGDVANKSGSSWLIERNEIAERDAQDISSDVMRLIHQNAAEPQRSADGPRTTSPNQQQPEHVMPPRDHEQGKPFPPKSLEEQIFRMARNAKAKMMEITPETEASIRKIETVLPDEIIEPPYKDDVKRYLDTLEPEGFTSYLKDIAKLQHTIRQKEGYMPVPLGIRQLYTARKLNRLGFSINPVEEAKAQFFRLQKPNEYLNRVAGMARSGLIGGYVPTISDWDENGGLPYMNSQVQSPGRFKVFEQEGKQEVVPDRTDLNFDLQKLLTQEELRY
ncbi:hypothetical protein TWF730_007549 [Orbilia blumenaviensis]